MLKMRCASVSMMVVMSGTVSGLAGPPTTAPAGRAGKSVDHVRELIDLYFQGHERDRFFAAAGVDGELSRQEFAAAAGRVNSFVRAYDRWASAVVYDRDRDGRLGWVEAEQYRLGIRKRVLALFDRDNDGRLAGPERDAANAYLGAGMGRPRILPPTSSRPARTGKEPAADHWAGPSGRGSPADPSWRSRWQQVQASYDADKDGKLSGDERQRMQEGLRQHYRQRLLTQFDKNRNGVLDKDEQLAAEMEDRREAVEWRRKWERTQWDANKDGRLDGNEQAAMEKHLAEQRRLAQQRRQQWIKRWDRNGDGKLSAEEGAEVTRDMHRRVLRQRKLMDTNGDGKITAKEIRAYREKLFGELRR